VSDAARSLAVARFRLIQRYWEERRFLQLVAADATLSFRTAERWVANTGSWDNIVCCATRVRRNNARDARVLHLRSASHPIFIFVTSLRLFAQGPYEESAWYSDFMGWEMP
jgi:hypothetical protein